MKNLVFFVLALVFLISSIRSFSQGKVTFKNDVNGKKIEVYLDSKFFTAFIYPDDMEKQVLFPIVSASFISQGQQY